MKIAISGESGVGKTLLAAMLSKIFAECGYSVIAIDADLAQSPHFEFQPADYGYGERYLSGSTVH